ncbi:hypothetical protein M8J75_012991 [Diaphorina citri]|nr:hypothetical protein M8J75_012991 [Diaphorina citri]
MPYITAWFRKCPSDLYRKTMTSLVHEHVAKMLDFKRQICEVIVPITDISCVASLCRLLECFTFKEKSLEKLSGDEAAYTHYAKLWFLFCMIWSICGSAKQNERRIIDSFIREREPIFPPKDTVYEYAIDKKTHAFVNWRDRLNDDWMYATMVPFYKVVVPTIDTIRFEYLISSLIQNGCHVLMLGPVGTGKTSMANKIMDLLSIDKYSALTINMSAHTSSNMVQDTILSRFKKRAKGVYIPQGNKTLVTFLDDMNMPAREKFGAQPPLELIRQWMDYRFWYDRKKKFTMTLHNMVLLGSMGPPGGGKNLPPNRLTNQFILINMAFPDKAQIQKIYSTMLYHHLRGFDESVYSCIENATMATLEVYMSDISRVFQGLLRSKPRAINDKVKFTRLWIHECYRVFSDRLVDEKDRDWFTSTMNTALAKYFDTTLQMIVPVAPLMFCDFMSETHEYDDITDLGVIRTFIMDKLDEYNRSPGVIRLNLVLFQFAIEHITRMTRVISQPRGHLLLVGLGGTGRTSLSILSSYLCHLKLFRIRDGMREFREDLRLLYERTGVRELPSCLVFHDMTGSNEQYFEILCQILSTGEVSKLFTNEELDSITFEVTDIMKRKKLNTKSVNAYNYFLDAVRCNLHLIICMSAVGSQFRDIQRQYPSIIDCTTIDWILDYESQEIDPKTDSKVVQNSMAKVFTCVHTSVTKWSKRMLSEIGRHNYTTLTNYIILVRGYKRMLEEKREELSRESNNLRNGLFKIDETKVIVEQMKVEMEENQVLVENYKKECDEFLVVIMEKKRNTDETAKQLTIRSNRIEEEKAECQELAIEAENDLKEAMPAMNEAVEALGALNKKDLTELKSFPRPNPKLMIVLDAVMTLLGCEPTFAEAKKQLGEPRFLESLYEYDKDHIPEKILKKITNYVNLPDFDPEEIGMVSVAAKSLSKWVMAIEKYAQLFKIIAPKKAKLEATIELKDSLERATLLLEGLSEERIRWEDSLRKMDEKYKLLPGDCLLGTAFLTYLGPFISVYREALFEIWIEASLDSVVITGI